MIENTLLLCYCFAVVVIIDAVVVVAAVEDGVQYVSNLWFILKSAIVLQTNILQKLMHPPICSVMHLNITVTTCNIKYSIHSITVRSAFKASKSMIHLFG